MESNWRYNVWRMGMWGSGWRLAARRLPLTFPPTYLVAIDSAPGLVFTYRLPPVGLPIQIQVEVVNPATPNFPYGKSVVPDFVPA